MAIQRGQFRLTSDGSLAVTAAGGFALLGPAAAGLATERDATSDDEFTMPQAGRLRYDGTVTRVFDVQGIVSLDNNGVPANDASVRARIAKNGTTLEQSEDEVTVTAVMGTASLSPATSVELATGDYLEIYVAVDSDSTLYARALSVLAVAFVAATTTGAPVEEDLRSFMGDCLDAGVEVTQDLAAARAFMVANLDDENLDTSLAYQIELRIAAHYVALRVPDCRVQSERAESVANTYGGLLKDGFNATFFGQAAIGLDPTGILSGATGGKPTLKFY